MKKLICLFILFTIPLVSMAQVNYTIKGEIVTANGYSPFGNAIALHPKDSSFIKGVPFFEGIFELNGIEQKEILLKLTSLEFDDLFLTVKYAGNPIVDLGKVVVQNTGVALDEIVVSAQKPVYTQKPDGTLEISIENTMLSATNSVNDILTRSPQIVMNEEGALSVLGKGAAIFYLNGKRILNNQLAMIAPSNIKKIEIIRNPSSKYDAEGAAVIHITTITKEDNGYQASLKQNVTHSEFGGTNTYSSVNVNYKQGKFSANGNYSLLLGNERELLRTTRDREPADGFLTTDLTTDWEYDYENHSYYGLGLQYDINKKSYLSLEYSGFMEKTGGNTLSDNDIIDDIGSSTFSSDIDVDEKDVNNSISLNYRTEIDTLGSSLFIGGQYAKFDIGADNFITEEGTEVGVEASRYIKNLLNLDIDLFSAQADFTKVFRNGSKLEFGTKFGHIENNFDFDFIVSTDGENFVLDEDISNEFYYRESIGAAYAAFRGSINKTIDYTVGVRSEYTKYNLELSQLGGEVIKNDYFNVFPNISISKRLPNKKTINLSYTARINRPPYQRLNPVLIYQDPYTSVQGNPRLLPQKVHAFELNTKIKGLRYTVGYNYTVDPFGQTVIQGTEPNTFILQRINYDKQHEFFGSVSGRFEAASWWTSRNTLTVSYRNLTETDFGFERVTPKPNVYFYSSNRFPISNTFSAEIIFWYSGDNHEGLHRRNSMYNVTASLEKSFFEKSLRLRLIANDIFHSRIASGNYNVGRTDVYYNRRWSTNYFRLSLMYNFGKLKKSNYKNKEVGELRKQKGSIR